MSLGLPFSLRIFVADDDPDGLRIVDKSNWIGKVLLCLACREGHHVRY